MKNKLKVGTIFTGIGAFEEGLKQLGIDFSVLFASDNGERYLNSEDENIIERNKNQELIKSIYEKYGVNYVKRTYLENFGENNLDWHEDVRYLNGKDFCNKIDILVGGSPCQAFSSIGKRKGFNDARGTLFFEYARILDETKPKYFIYENVPGIKTVDGKRTWNRILEIFGNLNYNYEVLELDAFDFGLPHKRKRIFIVGKRKDLGKWDEWKFDKIETIPLKKFLTDNNQVDKKYFLGKKGFEFVTNPKYSNRATVNREVLRTIKATQQYNWNGNFIFWETNKFVGDSKIHTGTWNGKTGVIRKMLPSELIALMGFKKFKLPNNPDQQLYRHSGNSIAVPVIKEITRRIWNDINK